MLATNIRKNTSNSHVLSRLLRMLPAASFELETFTQLTSVIMTHEVPTAAVDCQYRPRLMINPDFVAQYCQRDEHLFLLVMHELWHITLAHTSLYPRVTRAHNIAFDAIINAGLMRQFTGLEYRGFFDRLNPHDKFPHLLLRPPQGWRENPIYPDDVGPSGTTRILRQLYPPPGTQMNKMPLYQEILDLIRQDSATTAMPILVGDHSDGSDKRYQKPQLRDVMKQAVKRWPQQPMQFGKPGSGGITRQWQVDTSTSSENTRRAFANILRLIMGRSLGQYERKTRQNIRETVGRGVLPNGADRMVHARRGLGLPTTIWLNESDTRARVPQRQFSTYVYLDVSGSMSRTLPYLLTLLLPYAARGDAHVFQFSTNIQYLSPHDLKRSLVISSGGTSIHCVTQHVLAHKHRLQRVMLLTDGHTGQPSQNALAAIKELPNLRVHVVLPSESDYRQDLALLATRFHTLPPLARV